MWERRAGSFEKDKYGSLKDCKGECDSFYAAMLGDLAEQWVHEYNPHPEGY